MPSNDSEPTEMEVAAWELVVELLNSGSILTSLWGSLLAELSEESFPGEQPEAVLLEMMVGSSLVVLRKNGPDECRRATNLIQLIHERVKGDLRLAADIAGRRT